jgi:hexosaminidase
VVPEFDLPGHANSWLVGYPELASAPGPYQIERNWGIFDPTFDPTNKQTYKFLEKFFREMATLFPDEYWHIGGDENNGHQWDNNPQIQQFMVDNGLTNNHSLQNYFNAIWKKIGKRVKTMVGCIPMNSRIWGKNTLFSPGKVENRYTDRPAMVIVAYCRMDFILI